MMRTTGEPRDRRQLRLVQALLAFPAAGLIGFTGNAIVRSVRSEPAPVVSPATPDPGRDKAPSHEHEDDADRPRENSRVVRNV